MLDRSQFIVFKDQAFIDSQRVAGRCVASIHNELTEMTLHDKTYTGLEYQEKANEIFKLFDCTATFLNYKGFPGSICLSVNKQLVHGIPSDVQIVEGDVISFDLGATFREGIADAAVTVIKGKAKSPRHEEIVKVCKEALMNGIAAMKVGEAVGSIGYAIDRTVKKTPYGLITQYGGHGINADQVHAEPFIKNRSQKAEGVRVQIGTSIAIEPMVICTTNTSTRILPDGWTVVTNDIGCHFEHSVTIGMDGETLIQTKE